METCHFSQRFDIRRRLSPRSEPLVTQVDNTLVNSATALRHRGRFVMSDESSSFRTVSPESANRSANLRDVVDQRPPGNHTCGCAVTSMSMAQLETRPLVASEGVAGAGKRLIGG